MGHVDDGTGNGVLGGVDDQLESDLDLVGNVLAADFVVAQAKGTALLCAGRALAPADGTNTVSAVLTGRVAEGAALLLVLVAGQGRTLRAAVGGLGAGDADIGHASGAIG